MQLQYKLNTRGVTVNHNDSQKPFAPWLQALLSAPKNPEKKSKQCWQLKEII
jgi:hypothetical protein